MIKAFSWLKEILSQVRTFCSIVLIHTTSYILQLQWGSSCNRTAYSAILPWFGMETEKHHSCPPFVAIFCWIKVSILSIKMIWSYWLTCRGKHAYSAAVQPWGYRQCQVQDQHWHLRGSSHYPTLCVLTIIDFCYFLPMLLTKFYWTTKNLSLGSLSRVHVSTKFKPFWDNSEV